tara:strand:+ start:1773 stop:2096 length:324 start_codon:yes stop_codon:yes gene_type:complete
MNQLDMLSRRTDPETSREAARQMVESGALNAQSKFVLSVLTDNQGLTSRELADLGGGDVHQQRARFSRRLPDLMHRGIVTQGEARTCKACNRLCVTWFLANEVSYND